MALGTRAISYVRTNVSNLNGSKGIIDDCINTISYVKKNNDLTSWFDDTAIGTKWSQNVDKLIEATNKLSGSALKSLVDQTNKFLDEQETLNKNG